MRQGFREIIVTEPSHPFAKNWWPPGHLIGYEHTFVHSIADFVKAVATEEICRSRISRMDCEINGFWRPWLSSARTRQLGKL